MWKVAVIVVISSRYDRFMKSCSCTTFPKFLFHLKVLSDRCKSNHNH